MVFIHRISGMTTQRHFKIIFTVLCLLAANARIAQSQKENDPVITDARCVPDTVPADGQTFFRVQARVSDPNGMSNLRRVEVDLSPVGGSATVQMYDDGTHGDPIPGDSIFTRGNLIVPVNWPSGQYPLTITAVDSQDQSTQETAWIYVLPMNTAPVVGMVSVIPAQVQSNGIDAFSVLAEVIDANVASVIVNLTPVGGDSTVGMTAIGGGVFSAEGLIVSPGTPAGSYSLTVRATDTEGLTGTGNGLIEVIDPLIPPVIHWVVCRPPVLRAGALIPFSITAKVTDLNGSATISSVSLDLSQIQGSSSVQMNDNGILGDSAAADSIYSVGNLTVPSTVSPGDYTIYVTATDQQSLLDTRSLLIQVSANQSPLISDVQFTPPSVIANGIDMFRVQAWVNDPNGLADVAQVYIDLSPIGLGAQIHLYDDGTHGDPVAGDGIYTRHGLSVPTGISAGFYLTQTYVYDIGGLWHSYSVFLEVRDPLSIPGEKQLPVVFALHPNYPNPFNPATTISFDVARTSFVRVKIFDALGREVLTLIEKTLSPGRYHIPWNGKDRSGRAVASGVYFCRMQVAGNQTGKSIFTRKMLMLR